MLSDFMTKLNYSFLFIQPMS